MQQAGGVGQQMRDAFGRGVRAVRGAEGVVDVDVAELGELRGEGRIVAFFARRESARFPAAARRRRAARRPRVRRPSPTQSCAKATGIPSRSRERLARRARANISGRRFPSGRPRCESTIVRAPRSCSQRSVGSAASMRVSSRDRAAGHRNVEVLADQHALAADVADRRACETPYSGARPTSEALRGLSPSGRRGGTSSPTRCRTTRRSEPGRRWRWSVFRR